MQVLAVFHDGQQKQQVIFIGLRTCVEVSLLQNLNKIYYELTLYSTQNALLYETDYNAS